MQYEKGKRAIMCQIDSKLRWLDLDYKARLRARGMELIARNDDNLKLRVEF